MIENRKYIILGGFLLIGLIFVVKLFTLQVLESEYRKAAENNAVLKINEYPYRGVIYDRHGELLVYNVPVYDIMVTPRDASIKDTAAFCRLMGVTPEVLRTKLAEAKAYSTRKPSAFLKQVSERDFARIQDQLSDFPGFSVIPRTVRGYPHKSLASVLGYIGEISPTKLEAVADDRYRYSAGDYIGISGLEQQYEEVLRGSKGVKHLMVDVHGIRRGTFKSGTYDTTAIRGENLTTTIDLELQSYGERLMSNKLGSVVALDPRNGEVLAMVSSPTYDPNLLRGREFPRNFMALQQDPNKPLFVRPLMAGYPPGSIFKLMQGAIALQEDVLTTHNLIGCSAPVKCHGHPSPTNLQRAVQYSCNPYFYHIFRRIINQNKAKSTYEDSHLGLNLWRDYAVSFGMGYKLGIDLPGEKRGLIPNAGYYDKIYGEKRWKFSTVYSLSIGQGEIGLTPLQMANLCAIMANRGHFYTPHLVKRIGEADTIPAVFRERRETMVSAKHFDAIVEGMEDAVAAGTVWSAARPPADLEVCGKTGTSQNPHGEDHSVFIAFAPKNDPKIAIAAFVENAGFGGVVAAPIAGLMIEKYLSDTITTKRQWLEDYIIEKRFMPDRIQLTSN